MATVTLKNLSSLPVYIRDLQDSVAAGESVTITRSLGELTAMTALNGFIADGTLQLVSLVTSEPESFWANGGVRLVTTGPVTLYVSPTGSDTNTGLSASSPLLTVQAAIDKLPRLILHAVTINLAAGNYANAGFTLSGRTFGLLNGTFGGITIQGPATWSTVTLGAGSSTGTMTGAYVAPVVSTATPGTFTDSAQTWAADALKGKFLMMTSGTASGTIRVIVGNTSTALSLTTALSGVNVGDSYAIVEPAATLTASGTGWALEGLGGAGSSTTGAVILSDLKFTGATSSGPLFHVRNTKLASAPGVLFRRVIISDNGQSNALRITDSWAATSSQTCFFESATSSNPVVNVLGESVWQDAAGYTKCGAAMVQSAAWYGGRITLGGSGIAVVESGAAATTLHTITGNSSSPMLLTVVSAVIRSTATNTALTLGSFSSLPATNSALVTGGLRIVTAATGISIVGAAIRFSTGALYTSGVTNEMLIGATNFSYADLNAASPKFLLQPFNSSAEIRP